MTCTGVHVARDVFVYVHRAGTKRRVKSSSVVIPHSEAVLVCHFNCQHSPFKSAEWSLRAIQL